MNHDAIAWFLYVQTQWNVGPNGLVGLNYATALQCVQPLAGGSVLCPVKNIPQAMEGLRVIEAEILRIVNKK
jgi:hypothetical protein